MKLESHEPHFWIEIDTKVIRTNYQILKKLIHPGICAAVIKADAYGIGANNVGAELFKAGCRHFFVSYFEEADSVSKFFKNKLGVKSVYEDKPADNYNLFIFNGPFIGNEWCAKIYKQKHIPVLNSLQEVQVWNSFAKEIRRKLPAILHIDTGMKRLGLPMNEYKKLKKLDLEMIDWRFFMSHAVASLSPEHPANLEQLEKIAKIKEDFPLIPFSYGDSGTIIHTPKVFFDMVRPGVGIYGINNKIEGIKNSLTVKGKILQIQEISTGDGIGYGWKFKAPHKMKIATVACGYADCITVNGHLPMTYFYINNKKAKILGQVSMDLTVIDVTDIEEVQVGNEVIILGNFEEIEKISQQNNLSPHKILTGFGRRAKRIFI